MPNICSRGFLAFLLAGAVCAERPRVGLEAAISWPYAARQSDPGCAAPYGYCNTGRIYSHPAAFGPSLSYGLPFSLAVTAGALYSRVTRDEVGQILSVSGESSVTTAQTPASRWTVPILVEYRSF